MIELDERVTAGMREQLAARADRLRAGERPLGWKLGFGAPAAKTRLRIDRPLVGFLLESNLLPDGATVPVGEWSAAVLEPEVAVHLAHDIEPGAPAEAVRDAIGGIGPAIELVDLAPPPDDVRAMLAGNIYHRHVLLGPVNEGRTSPDGVTARVRRDGEPVAGTDDVTELVGDLVEVVRLTAEVLEACGERLRAGEVIITGSVVPAVPVASGQHIDVDLPPLGGLSVRLA